MRSKYLGFSFQEFTPFAESHFLTVSVKCFLCALLQEYLQNNNVVLYMSDVSVNRSNYCTDVHEKWQRVNDLY